LTDLFNELLLWIKFLYLVLTRHVLLNNRFVCIYYFWLRYFYGSRNVYLLIIARFNIRLNYPLFKYYLFKVNLITLFVKTEDRKDFLNDILM